MFHALRVVLLLMVLFVLGCTPPKAPSTSITPPSGGVENPGGTVSNSVPPIGDSDRVLHGIRLGSTVDAAKGQLVSPVYNRAPDGAESWRQGDDKGVSFTFENGIVWRVRDALGPTPRGLNIGDSTQKLGELYGKPVEVNKYGWWMYKGTGGFSLTVAVQDGAVRSVAIEDKTVSTPLPEHGRDVPSHGDVHPFGTGDYSLSGVRVCSLITDLRADPRFEETLGSAERGTLIGFITRDKLMRVDPADSGSMRVDSIEVIGGAYETARGVRVGDPLTRAEVLYGNHLMQDDNASLDFVTNVNGRIEKIVMNCIRSGPADPSNLSGASASVSPEVSFEGVLAGVGEELIIKYGVRTFLHKLGAEAQVLSKGKPLPHSDLRTGMKVRVTVRDGTIVQVDVLSSPE